MNWRLAGSIIGCVLLSSCGTAFVRPTPQSQDPARFTYTRLYCTPDNESHFETVTVDLAKVDATPPVPPTFVKANPASRTILAGFDPRWGAHDAQARQFHPAPSAQFVVYLQGVMSITTTDGEPGTSDLVTCCESKTQLPARGTSASSATKPRSR
jgi:hypothetical protein